jgi:hypothetical protein
MILESPSQSTKPGQLQLYHHQSASRGPYNPKKDRKPEALLRRRWGKVLDNDPYYSPHLTRQHFDFSLRTDEPAP